MNRNEGVDDASCSEGVAERMARAPVGDDPGPPRITSSNRVSGPMSEVSSRSFPPLPEDGPGGLPAPGLGTPAIEGVNGHRHRLEEPAERQDARHDCPQPAADMAAVMQLPAAEVASRAPDADDLPYRYDQHERRKRGDDDDPRPRGIIARQAVQAPIHGRDHQVEDDAVGPERVTERQFALPGGDNPAPQRILGRRRGGAGRRAVRSVPRSSPPFRGGPGGPCRPRQRWPKSIPASGRRSTRNTRSVHDRAASGAAGRPPSRAEPRGCGRGRPPPSAPVGPVLRGDLPAVLAPLAKRFDIPGSLSM